MSERVAIRTRLIGTLLMLLACGGQQSDGSRAAAEFSLGDSEWERIADLELGRWEAATVVLDDKLYTFGGYTPGPTSSARVDVFDPSDQSWTGLTELPSAITHFNAVLDGRSVWIAGGFKDGYPGHAITEVWRYDIDSDSYTAGPPLPEPRAGGGLALVDRRLHYFSGLMEDRDTDSPDHWVLDLANAAPAWEDAAPMPEPRNQFSAIALDDLIYAIGGQYHHDSGQADQPRVDIYHAATDSWTRGPDLPAAHSHAEGSSFVSDGRIFILGGMTREGGERVFDASVISRAPDGQWSILGELPIALSSPIAAIIGERLYVGGGSPDGSTIAAEMWSRVLP